MNETETARFEETLRHLATKEELLLLKVDVHKFKTDLILWIIGTNLAVGGTLVGVMIFLVNQLDSKFTLLLQHWKP